MMNLYGYWRSSASYRVRIGLNLKGITVNHIAVNLKDGEQLTTDWTMKNPQNLVPVLELDDGILLRQSLPILEYLDAEFSAYPLLPKDPVQKANIRACANIIASEIAPLQNLRVLKKIKSAFGASQEQSAQWARHWIALGFEALETMARTADRQNDFLFGEKAGLVECVLVPQLYNARRFDVDLTPFSRLLAVEEKCLALSAFQQAHPNQQQDAPRAQSMA